jgi:endonuclease YncB( thermonuclease family)
MAFVLIKGVFNPQNGEPDGDSVRFLADDDTLFEQLEGQVKFKSPNGEVQLRYEGVDALEKAALKPFSSDATKRNLALLGGEDNGQPGFILSSHVDPHGRPVCFVFAGEALEADGSEVFLEVDRLRDSLNYQLLHEGILYPMFYETLYKEIRDDMTAAVKVARTAKKGIWAKDASNQGVIIKPAPNLAKLDPIFPKIWRRLNDFYSRPSNRNKPVSAFVKELAKGSDRLFTVPDQRWIKLSTALEVNGDKLKLKYKPEEMIFWG